jgi:hypothetical protein
MIQEELSGEIIGPGMYVMNELRPGLDQKLRRLPRAERQFNQVNVILGI